MQLEPQKKKLKTWFVKVVDAIAKDIWFVFCGNKPSYMATIQPMLQCLVS